jgi:trigger factor
LGEAGDAPVIDFAEKLMGMSAGEERDFSVTFPDDYEDQDLAGKEASFHARLHSLQEKHLPAADDELAKMVGGFDTLEGLRESIEEDLRVRREAQQYDELGEQLLDAILEQAEIDSPPVFVNTELEAMLRGLVYDLQQQGFTLEGYLRATDRTMEDLIEEFRPTAEKRVMKSLILAELVKQEEIEVQDSEIEEDVARMTSVYGQEKQVLQDALLGNEQVKEEIRNRLYGRKVVQRLLTQSEAEENEKAGGSSAEVEGDESSTDLTEEPASAE